MNKSRYFQNKGTAPWNLTGGCGLSLWHVDRRKVLSSPWAPPGRGKGGHLTPLDFDIKFSHIITVVPTVEIQMHFWKGAKFAGSVGHPMTKMLSASEGLRSLIP